jgi:hypothetical protein
VRCDRCCSTKIDLTLLTLQLNFDQDDQYHYYNEEFTGPLHPGNAFYQWLGRGTVPLRVPMPDTLIIGYPPHHSLNNNNDNVIPPPTTLAPQSAAEMINVPSNVKLLSFDFKKQFLTTQYGHFDSQDLRDSFFELCCDKFLEPYSLRSIGNAKEAQRGERHRPTSAGTVRRTPVKPRLALAMETTTTSTKTDITAFDNDRKGHTVDLRPESNQHPTDNRSRPAVCDNRVEDIMTVAPLYNRFVAVQKRPVIGKVSDTNQNSYSRKDTHQQCELMLSFGFQAMLFELFDSMGNSGSSSASNENNSSFVMQRFIKSRGRRPAVYRIFWNNGSGDMGIAEGWNITKQEEEFILPSLITTDSASLTTNSANMDEDIDNNAEAEFQKMTVAFLANVLLQGQRKDVVECESKPTTARFSPVSDSANPFSARGSKKTTFMTESSTTEEANAIIREANARSVVETLFKKSNEELDS